MNTFNRPRSRGSQMFGFGFRPSEFFRVSVFELRISAVVPLLLLLLLTASATAGSSPFLIPYQGRLTNPQGVPYTNGQYTLAFTLYDQPVGGTVKWGPETHYRVGVINGMVNVFLGSILPLPSDFSETRHLGITIYADNNPNNPAPEMVPRQMIIPAFWAKNSEKLNGYDWTPVFGANNPTIPLPGAKIQNSSITRDQIAVQTITAAQIANNTITSQQLAGAIITSNQIVAGSISSLNLAPGSVLTTNIADGQVTLQKLIPRLGGTNVPSGGIAVSLSSGSIQYYSGTSFQNIANLTVTIQTTGRPVLVFIAPSPDNNLYDTPSNTPDRGVLWDTGTSGGKMAMLRLLRDTNQWAITADLGTGAGGGVSTGYAMPLFVVDFPPTGSHTYQVQWGYTSSPSSGAFLSIENMVLVALEL